MRKIVSFLLIAVFLIIPVSAATSSSSDVEYVQKSGFWTWAAGKGKPLNGIIGHTFGAVCPNSEDGYHHASSYQRPEASWGGLTGYYKCICDLCGAEFKAYESDLQQSYDSQVAELPAQGYTSDGGLMVFIPVSSLFVSTYFNDIVYWDCTHCDKHTKPSSWPFSVNIDENTHVCTLSPRSGGSLLNQYWIDVNFLYHSLCPVSGFYSTCGGIVDAYYLDGKNQKIDCSLDFQKVGSNIVYYSLGDIFSFSFTVQLGSGRKFAYLSPSSLVLSVTPDTAFGGVTYNITSRPTSITGNYGIIGDNGQIIKVEGDKIVNETNNTYYNPATGTTDTITDWSYNYEDRSYTLTLGGGTTTTVTYGDENVTIKEGDTTYNIYYLVDGGGSETPGPEVCDHDWAEDSTIRPTCSTPGKITMTCSKCSQTKTENLPALGHNWTVDRTVQTSYDEQGNLVQQGYTIYKCSVCGEQYKDSEGTGPPGTPGGSGPGSSGGDGEKSIWEKIGEFFGTIGGGFLEIIGAVAGKLLDALTKLAEMLLGKLKTVVETILTIFDEVPALFGGFLDFLGAVFPFLPPEITTILTFGVIAITFIGILKAVRR